MFPQLQTPRFLLLQVEEADADFLLEGLSDPIAMPHNGVYFYSREEIQIQLDWYAKNYSEGTGLNWKITKKDTGERVGVASMYNYKPEHRKAEIGYWLIPRFWNLGICSEVLPVIMDYWRAEKGLHRVEAFVEDGNTASIKLLEKLGFIHEGCMRDCEIKFGKFISLHVYGKVKNEK